MKWIKAKILPDYDKYDEPTKYVARFKGDDPRSGWVDIALMTRDEMEKEKYDNYWEWLDESNDEVEQLLHKNEELRKECLRVKQQRNEYELSEIKLHREIRVLSAENKDYKHTNEQLRKENERLTEALEKIKDLVPQEGGKSIVEYYLDYVEELQSIATEALTPQP